MTETTTQLRNVYNAAQFAAEVLCNTRTARWVADQCRAKKIRTIKTTPHAPWLIPMSEALRFMGK